MIKVTCAGNRGMEGRPRTPPPPPPPQPCVQPDAGLDDADDAEAIEEYRQWVWGDEGAQREASVDSTLLNESEGQDLIDELLAFTPVVIPLPPPPSSPPATPPPAYVDEASSSTTDLRTRLVRERGYLYTPPPPARRPSPLVYWDPETNRWLARNPQPSTGWITPSSRRDPSPPPPPPPIV